MVGIKLEKHKPLKLCTVIILQDNILRRLGLVSKALKFYQMSRDISSYIVLTRQDERLTLSITDKKISFDGPFHSSRALYFIL